MKPLVGSVARGKSNPAIVTQLQRLDASIGLKPQSDAEIMAELARVEEFQKTPRLVNYATAPLGAKKYDSAAFASMTSQGR